MRKGIHILLFIVFAFISCKSDESKVSGYWLGDYYIEDKTYSSRRNSIEYKGLHRSTGDLDRMLFFKGDSLISTLFTRTEHSFSESEMKVQLTKDSLILQDRDSTNSIKFSFRSGEKDSLVLEGENSENSVMHFENNYFKLKEYNMTDKKQIISTFLRSNPITIDKRTDRVELLDPYWLHMGIMVQDSLKANYGRSSYWYLFSLGKELFLVIGDQLIHISNFKNEILYGNNYRKKNSAIEIRSSTYKNSYEIDDLIGEWIMMDNSINKNEYNYIQKIKIDSSNLIIDRLKSTETLQWKLNKGKNKIFFENNQNPRDFLYWKIESLFLNRLVLKMKNGHGRGSFVKTMSLYRK